MERNNILQIFSGTFVVLVVVFIFIFLNINHGFMKKRECYQVLAKFNNISGLSVGSVVKINGVNIGKVLSIKLDDNLTKVLVSMCIDNGVKLPIDSVAIISSENLLSGTKFVNIELGVDSELIKKGDCIAMTQSSLIFEDLVKQFIANRA